jgi:DNA-binding transcriptional LysR family regulator
MPAQVAFPFNVDLFLAAVPLRGYGDRHDPGFASAARPMRPEPQLPFFQIAISHVLVVELRVCADGAGYAWEVENGKRELRVRVERRRLFNRTAPMLTAALAGIGVIYVPNHSVRAFLADGRLIRALPTLRSSTVTLQQR